MVPDDPKFDKGALRAVLGAFATGIAVVTMRNGSGQARAITINSFTSVSLEPPLILFCLDKAAFHYASFAGADAFAINILSDGQKALSNRFAAEAEDGFEDLKVEAMATGSPIFPGALAVLDCTREAAHEAGDHLILIGRVKALKAPLDADPLLYFRGAYAGVTR